MRYEAQAFKLGGWKKSISAVLPFLSLLYPWDKEWQETGRDVSIYTTLRLSTPIAATSPFLCFPRSLGASCRAAHKKESLQSLCLVLTGPGWDMLHLTMSCKIKTDLFQWVSSIRVSCHPRQEKTLAAIFFSPVFKQIYTFPFRKAFCCASETQWKYFRKTC